MIAGVDIGGTKTHLRGVAADDPQVVVVDRIVPSTGWAATPVRQAAAWLAARLPPGVQALAVGAQGCEDPAHQDALRTALADHLSVPVTVVNDAQLLLPAFGLSAGIAVVVGTGSIAVHDDGRGTVTRAGGWGWVLGDDGSASALVREAARAVLAGHDRGEPLSLLGSRLLASVGVPSVLDLAAALSWGDAPESWGRHCPVVVEVAQAGDLDAQTVLDDGARSIVTLVATLAGRGLSIEDIVFAGGLVANVASYWTAIRDLVGEQFPDAQARLLTTPPVAGAVALALRL